jgi:hypothetical protein
VQFQVDETDTGKVTLQISGEGTDNSTPFTSGSHNVSSRNTTTATVSWAPPDWTKVGSAGVDQQTADISSIVQEIVNRPGWKADNALSLIDDDRDGYFYGIDLLIDADTIYGVADVYAAVYLSLEGGPWNEYAVTEDFTIFGASGDDEFVLVTELMSGYPTGSYDLLIELFDAWDGSYVASFGPEDTSELAYLPLEDFNRDEPRYDPPVVVSHGGGGAAGLWLLLPLLAFTIRRRFL